MTLKSDAKLTFGFKYDMRNLVNSPNHSKIWKFHFNRLFLSFGLKNTEKLSLMILTSKMQNLNTLPGLLVSKMAWGIGWTFIRALKRLNIVLWWAFLSKDVSASKFQRNYESWNWRIMQNLKENWLVACKMT